MTKVNKAAKRVYINCERDWQFVHKLAHANVAKGPSGPYVLPAGFSPEWVANLLELLVAEPGCAMERNHEFSLMECVEHLVSKVPYLGFEATRLHEEQKLDENSDYWDEEDCHKRHGVPFKTLARWSSDDQPPTDAELTVVAERGFCNVLDEARLADYAVHTLRLTLMAYHFRYDPRWRSKLGRWYEVRQTQIERADD